METILITGASGFVGKEIARLFLSKGYTVTGIGTSKSHPFMSQFSEFKWISADTSIKGKWQYSVAESDIIINLAGKNIFHYWTEKYKKQIYDSRVLTTRNIVDAIEKGKTQKLLTTSAVGIYGDCRDDLLIEDRESGRDFLAEVCADWEKEALKAGGKGVQVAVMRLGVVLGHGGALSKMLPAFKMFAGGPLGNGQHWFPWIHIRDVEKAVEFLIGNNGIDGAYNFTAPEPVRQKEFAKALGKAVKRPAFMPAPAFIIKTFMGELGRALLQSQKASPAHLLEKGYAFLFTDVNAALNDILK